MNIRNVSQIKLYYYLTAFETQKRHIALKFFSYNTINLRKELSNIKNLLTLNDSPTVISVYPAVRKMDLL